MLTIESPELRIRAAQLTPAYRLGKYGQLEKQPNNVLLALNAVRFFSLIEKDLAQTLQEKAKAIIKPSSS